MSLREHAERELKHWIESDNKMSRLMAKQVLQLIDLFAEHGHSGSSAPIAIATFERLARYEPLRPLTGEADEWTEVGNGVEQNKRCPHVFRENGVAYDIDGIVFREPSGACFTNRDSRVPVTFPYTPKTEYRDVPARAEGS